MKDRTQIVMIVSSVAALALAAWLLVPYLQSAPGPLTEIYFVCVATGEVVELTVDEAGMIPAKNRKTGERTMVPCVRSDDGGYRAAASYKQLLEGRLKDVNRFVDPVTLEVLSKARG